jgi:hypothetical protein
MNPMDTDCDGDASNELIYPTDKQLENGISPGNVQRTITVPFLVRRLRVSGEKKLDHHCIAFLAGFEERRPTSRILFVDVMASVKQLCYCFCAAPLRSTAKGIF